MISIQEYLETEYPTKEDKQKVRVINVSYYSSRFREKQIEIDNVLTEIDLREFKNVERINVCGRNFSVLDITGCDKIISLRLNCLLDRKHNSEEMIFAYPKQKRENLFYKVKGYTKELAWRIWINYFVRNYDVGKIGDAEYHLKMGRLISLSNISCIIDDTTVDNLGNKIIARNLIIANRLADGIDKDYENRIIEASEEAGRCDKMNPKEGFSLQDYQEGVDRALACNLELLKNLQDLPYLTPKYKFEFRVRDKNKQEQPSEYQLIKSITGIKKDYPFLKEVHSTVLQVIAKQRYNSITYPFPIDYVKGSGYKIDNSPLTEKKEVRKLKLSLGRQNNHNIQITTKLTMDRNFQGDCKTLTIKRKNNRCYALFNCENIPLKPLPKTGKTNGYDLGITNLLVDVNDKKTKNPRFYKKSEKIIKQANQSLSNKVQGIANEIVKEHDVIKVEDLNVKGMLEKKLGDGKKSLRRSLMGTKLGLTLKLLAEAAEIATRQLIRVDPKNTTQMCSNYRDWNSARNIHNREEIGSTRPLPRERWQEITYKCSDRVPGEPRCFVRSYSPPRGFSWGSSSSSAFKSSVGSSSSFYTQPKTGLSCDVCRGEFKEQVRLEKLERKRKEDFILLNSYFCSFCNENHIEGCPKFLKVNPEKGKLSGIQNENFEKVRDFSDEFQNSNPHTHDSQIPKNISHFGTVFKKSNGVVYVVNEKTLVLIFISLSLEIDVSKRIYQLVDTNQYCHSKCYYDILRIQEEIEKWREEKRIPIKLVGGFPSEEDIKKIGIISKYGYIKLEEVYHFAETDVSYLDKLYPKKENRGLKGYLDLSDFVALRILNCSNNEITRINLTNNTQLEILIINSNYIQADLSIFSHLTNLRILDLGLKGRETNNFSGSLKSLENCKNLVFLNIHGQEEINEDLEYLPITSLAHFEGAGARDEPEIALPSHPLTPEEFNSLVKKEKTDTFFELVEIYLEGGGKEKVKQQFKGVSDKKISGLVHLDIEMKGIRQTTLEEITKLIAKLSMEKGKERELEKKREGEFLRQKHGFQYTWNRRFLEKELKKEELRQSIPERVLSIYKPTDPLMEDDWSEN
ncbi:10358_t:CDS:10 [Funneliformis geosporum]|nr:10358_t:CDS:10 [Funneliformis geosporum]